MTLLTRITEALKLKNPPKDKEKPPVIIVSHGHNRKIPAIIISHGHNRKLPTVKESIEDWEHDNKNETNDDDILKNIRLLRKHKANRTSDDETALKSYVSAGLDAGHETGSRALNYHLLEMHNANKPKPSSFELKNEDGGKIHYNLTHLDAALNRNKLTEPLTTYSGIGFDPSKLGSHSGVVHMPSYTSSSLDKKTATKYAATVGDTKHVIQIEHDVGHPGAYIGNDKTVTPFRDNEYIMPRGSNLSIHPIPEEHRSEHDGEHFKIWKARRL